MNTSTTVAGGNVTAEIRHLYRVRNGVRAALALGVAASVVGNVLHAEPTIVGRAIAAWSPLALLLTVELISRVPVSSRALAVLRMLSTAVIAGIAAWVSYWHMVAVAAHNGESTTSAHLLPLSVDGLVVVASVSLVEIAVRLRHASTPDTDPAGHDTTAESTPTQVLASEPETEPIEASGSVPPPRPAPRTTSQPGRSTRPAAARSTAVTVSRLREKHPDWTLAAIAAKAGVTERTVRRHLNTSTTAADPDTASTDLAA